MKGNYKKYIRFAVYIVAFILSVFAFEINIVFGICATFITVFLFVLELLLLNKVGDSFKKSVKKAISQLDFAAKNMLTSCPLPVIVLNRDGYIIWYNDTFSEVFKDVGIAFGEDMKKYLPEFNNDILNENDVLSGNIGGRDFTVYQNLLTTDDFDNMFALYFIEDTYYKSIEKRFSESMPCVAQILLDNYEDATSGIKETDKVKLISQITDLLNSYTATVNGILYKLAKDKYVMIFERKGLESLIKDKFSVLDKVRGLTTGSKNPLTLSFGIGNSGTNLRESAAQAIQGLDMALGRGGDQVVIKNDEKLEFYGGKSQSVVSRSRVKVRMVTNAILELINASSNVIIMGHKYADLDALASAIGMARLVISLGKPCSVVINTEANACQKMIDNYMESGFESYFCDSQQAILNTEKNTLLIVVDTHSPKLCESIDLLESCQRVVVIDHHRRLSEYIDKTLISYHESFASSASEMVCDILNTFGKETIKQQDASALLAGIMLDTKDFILNTSSRTFEAAGYLRTIGGDTIEAKKYFSIDLNNYKIRSKIVADAFRYNDKYAISQYNGEAFDGIGPLVAASADELLSIDGIKASFVLYKTGNNTHISCRSLGDINVQMIAEKLSGGGHFTSSAAQIENTDLETAKDMLIKAIDEISQE